MTDFLESARGVKLLIKVGNGAAPEVFAAMCSINAQRGISFAAGTSDSDIIDCANPEAVAYVAREKTNLSSSIDGAGTADTRDLAALTAWWQSPDSKNCEAIVDVPGASGGIIWTAAYHLTNFTLTGNRGGKIQFTCKLDSDGVISSVANA